MCAACAWLLQRSAAVYCVDEMSPTQSPCDSSELHPDLHYNDASATWVLIAAIIVFFMVRMTQIGTTIRIHVYPSS